MAGRKKQDRGSPVKLPHDRQERLLAVYMEREKYGLSSAPAGPSVWRMRVCPADGACAIQLRPIDRPKRMTQRTNAFGSEPVLFSGTRPAVGAPGCRNTPTPERQSSALRGVRDCLRQQISLLMAILGIIFLPDDMTDRPESCLLPCAEKLYPAPAITQKLFGFKTQYRSENAARNSGFPLSFLIVRPLLSR
jgi:hypothetical protein